MSRLMSFLLAGMLLSACTSIKVSSVDKTEQQQLQEICIVDNPRVIVEDFVPVVQNRLQFHGIRTRLVNSQNEPECRYYLKYSAKRSWDFTPFLSWAELKLYRGQELIAQAEYKLIGKGGFSLMKWQSVETKMTPVVDQLLGK